MNLKQIKALDTASLLAHAMNVESRVTKEENMKGTTIATRKDYVWTVKELGRRFNVDPKEIAEQTGALHWFEDEEI